MEEMYEDEMSVKTTGKGMDLTINPRAFLSYAHFDDQWELGKITEFREALSAAYRSVTGTGKLTIFQDRNDIRWGNHWPTTLERALTQANFLISILTPNYFASAACREELKKFFDYENAIEKRRDLVLPIKWIGGQYLDNPEDELALELRTRQHISWEPLRQANISSKRVRVGLEKIAREIERRAASLAQQPIVLEITTSSSGAAIGATPPTTAEPSTSASEIERRAASLAQQPIAPEITTSSNGAATGATPPTTAEPSTSASEISPLRNKIAYIAQKIGRIIQDVGYVKITAALIIVSAIFILSTLSWDPSKPVFFSEQAFRTRFDGTPHVPSSSDRSDKIVYLGDQSDSQFGVRLDNELAERFKLDAGVLVDDQHVKAKDKHDTIRNAIQNEKFGRYDVISIDIGWAPEFANSLIDLGPFFEPGHVSVDNDTNKYDRQSLESSMIGNKLVAIPFFRDVGVLYYNKAFVHGQPPVTWEDLEEKAAAIQYAQRKAGNQNFIGFAWQGDDYEGLTCNALEWIASQGGIGALQWIASRGSFDNEAFEAVYIALNRARLWIIGKSFEQLGGERIAISYAESAPPSESIMTYEEEQSLDKFIKGEAAFLRHWPYAYHEIKEKAKDVSFGVWPLPREPLPRDNSQKSFGTLGGWQLAVPENARNRLEAVKFIRYLTSRDVQKWRADMGFYIPTRKDARPLESPELADIVESVQMIKRSSNPINNYPEASQCFRGKVREILTSHADDSEVRRKVEEIRLCNVKIDATVINQTQDAR